MKRNGDTGINHEWIIAGIITVKIVIVQSPKLTNSNPWSSGRRIIIIIIIVNINIIIIIVC